MFRHMKASDLNTVVGKVISVGKNAVKEEKLINKITKKYILWYDTTDIYIVLGNICSLLFFGEF